MCRLFSFHFPCLWNISHQFPINYSSLSCLSISFTEPKVYDTTLYFNQCFNSLGHMSFGQSSHNFCMYFLNQRHADDVHIHVVYCGSCQSLTGLLIFQCCSLLSWLRSSVVDDHPFSFHTYVTLLLGDL